MRVCLRVHINVGISFALLSIVNVIECKRRAFGRYTVRNTRAVQTPFWPQVLSHGGQIPAGSDQETCCASPAQSHNDLSPPRLPARACSPSMRMPDGLVSAPKQLKTSRFRRLASPVHHYTRYRSIVTYSSTLCGAAASCRCWLCQAACGAAAPLNTEQRRSSTTVTAVSCVYSTEMFMSVHSNSACMSYVNCTRVVSPLRACAHTRDESE